MAINRAFDLLDSGESAIVLFTRELNLVEPNADGSGTSGNWLTNPDYHDQPDKVIIYNRLPGQVSSETEVYLANYVDAIESKSPGRYIIHYQDFVLKGTTNSSWYEFADTGPNPVRYLR